MTLQLYHPEDLERLLQRVAREKNAKQRDRYPAVLLVAEHSFEGDDVAERLGRSPRFVDEWVVRDRRGGIDALVPCKQPGQRPKLTSDQEVALKARLDAGPRAGGRRLHAAGQGHRPHPRAGVRSQTHPRRHLRRARTHRLLLPLSPAEERKPGEHFVLIMEHAAEGKPYHGWHKSKAMKLPEGFTVLLLPPYSPELNPVENLWHYLRCHYLSNRAFRD